MGKFYFTVPTALASRLYHVNLADPEVKSTISWKWVEDLDAMKKYNASVIEFTLNDPVEEGLRNSFVLTEYYYNRFDCLPKKITI